ncbi:MAG: 16S rRNA (uracil(1498)-N(3))-methyltransferase [Actinomycetota bacterium]|nr:16S rRNA (uracil(1498)-N(3))-methyltransferase [Actinomycetota bacterium]
MTRTTITRIFVDAALEEASDLILPSGEAHHLQNVLRARPGDIFEVVDATRALFTAELHEGAEAVILSKLQEPGRARAEVTLYQGVPKGKHMDLVVEKATELGVGSVTPLVTERSIVRPDGRGGKVERWRKLAQSAARQSLQLRVPDVAEPVTFGEALRKVAGEGILLHNEPDLPALEEVVAGPSVSLFVGPEGGWSEREVERAGDAGVPVAQLGPYRLRSETAGIIAVARAMAALERS